MITTNERWKPVPVAGFETAYEVSDQGRIRRSTAGKSTRAGRIRKSIRGRRNTVVLSGGSRKDVRGFQVDRLVAKAFLPECQPGQFLKHLNEDNHDDRAANLSWSATRKHDLDGDPKPKGEQHGAHKLTERDVLEIRAEANGDQSWRTARAIAESYPVTPSAVWHILVNRTWRHLVPTT